MPSLPAGWNAGDVAILPRSTKVGRSRFVWTSTRRPLGSVKDTGASTLRALVGVRTARAIHDGTTIGPFGIRFEKSSVAEALLFWELPRGGLSLGVRWPTTVGRLKYVRAAAIRSASVKA